MGLFRSAMSGVTLVHSYVIIFVLSTDALACLQASNAPRPQPTECIASISRHAPACHRKHCLLLLSCYDLLILASSCNLQVSFRVPFRHFGLALLCAPNSWILRNILRRCAHPVRKCALNLETQQSGQGGARTVGIGAGTAELRGTEDLRWERRAAIGLAWTEAV